MSDRGSGARLNRQQWRKLILLIPFILFQFPLFHSFMSPVLLVRAASLGVVNASMIIYAVLLVTSLFLGRAFCAWACPGAIIQEACTAMGARRIKSPEKYWFKSVVATVLFSTTAVAAIHAGGFHRVDWFFGDMGKSPAPLIMRFGAFVILIPLSFLFGRWAFCRHACWIAPLMIAGTRLRERLRLPGLRLTTDPTACTECATCEETCPMSLPVAQMVSVGRQSEECILCGNCADSCPAGAIRLHFSAPR